MFHQIVVSRRRALTQARRHRARPPPSPSSLSHLASSVFTPTSRRLHLHHPSTPLETSLVARRSSRSIRTLSLESPPRRARSPAARRRIPYPPPQPLATPRTTAPGVPARSITVFARSPTPRSSPRRSFLLSRARRRRPACSVFLKSRGRDATRRRLPRTRDVHAFERSVERSVDRSIDRSIDRSSRRVAS